ncbi:unnamed protein product [Schistocephalus solidus]|uniref:Uncharacterized protein n=1 Tax=Schistocephalus solidus TaxID=70667 RepID=A0A183TN33_SCHSO|nr:unnamed protein product [Schistocephalus solidus]
MRPRNRVVDSAGRYLKQRRSSNFEFEHYQRSETLSSPAAAATADEDEAVAVAVLALERFAGKKNNIYQ